MTKRGWSRSGNFCGLFNPLSNKKQIQVIIALTGTLFVGCATDSDGLRRHQEKKIARGEYFLAESNATAGAFYELGIYVIEKGDTLAKVAGQFHLSVVEIMAVNPGLNPNRLLIGQKIRIYERNQN
ncbi:MAG: LysM domain-containing protein [Verrucomicrobiota bacterium]